MKILRFYQPQGRIWVIGVEHSFNSSAGFAVAGGSYVIEKFTLFYLHGFTRARCIFLLCHNSTPLITEKCSFSSLLIIAGSLLSGDRINWYQPLTI